MIEEDFIAIISKVEGARVLDLGSKRSVPDCSTHHKGWCHPSANVTLSDFQEGLDVDIVADVHSLSDVFPANTFDFIICCSVMEHVQRPWIAAHEIARVVKPGGQIYVQTHQSFPLHGYPNDYWRFTTDSLRTLFEDCGLSTVEATYRFPAQVVSQQDPGGKEFPAFLNVNILARKPDDWRDFIGYRHWLAARNSRVTRQGWRSFFRRAGGRCNGRE